MCDSLDPQLRVRLFGSITGDEKNTSITSDERTPSSRADSMTLGRRDRPGTNARRKNMNRERVMTKEVDEGREDSLERNNTYVESDQQSDQVVTKRTVLWPSDQCLKVTTKNVTTLSHFKSLRKNYNNKLHKISSLVLVLLLVLITGCQIPSADACSSRSTPKPRPPSQSAIRPNITFQTYACPPAYAAFFCLNGATCFTVKIADSILYNCECADGFMGQRCEFKDLDGTYLPTKERLIQLKNSPFGLALALVLTIVISIAIISAIVTTLRTKYKLNINNNNNNNNDSECHTIPSNCASYSMNHRAESPFTISSHCDVIRGYSLGNSVIRNHANENRTTSWNYNYSSSNPNRYPTSAESRQRSYILNTNSNSHFSM